jgi:hypothetical protein
MTTLLRREQAVWGLRREVCALSLSKGALRRAQRSLKCRAPTVCSQCSTKQAS